MEKNIAGKVIKSLMIFTLRGQLNCRRCPIWIDMSFLTTIWTDFSSFRETTIKLIRV